MSRTQMGRLAIGWLQLHQLTFLGLGILGSTINIPRAIALPAAGHDLPKAPSCTLASCGQVLSQGNDPGQSRIIPASDIPEEILRTKLVLEGRSPIDGTLLSPEDYVQLQEQLIEQQNATLPVSAELQSLVFQLKLLNLLKTILPIF